MLRGLQFGPQKTENLLSPHRISLILEIPDFLSDQECQQLISLAKESGLRTSVAGNQSYEGDLDEVMKEAGKHAHLYWVQLLYTNECLS